MATEHNSTEAATDIHETASIRESDTRGILLPTDSMVTVRLSDPLVVPSSAISPDNQISVAALAQFLPDTHGQDQILHEDILDAYHIKHTSSGQGLQRDDSGTDPDENAAAIGEEYQESTVSMTSNRSRSDSSGSALSSNGSAQVDWDELEKSEEQAPRDEGSDESTAFLLARLEQENNALATNPKAALARARSTRKCTKVRPPSIQHLKKLVTEPTKPSLRYSLIPDPPPMTELEFWAALVNDYPQTAQRLPTLTSNKIRSGVPPPLRGVVWMSIAGSRDPLLEHEYDKLCGESSPYENLIGKDIGRSFPGVEMFRDPSGDGQQMLGRVLRCFSLYDQKIGYCQGLGFVVGPLLMHMGDKEAFCVLVRLMEHYDLRSCFLPDLSGLHLRIYQFQHLLSKHLPRLTAHMESLQVEPLYVSQWFLSFFAVTCPLPMLLRIYDVILTEGASETLMRVALSLMRRNETRILACIEFEDVMSLLLSRALWDTYGSNADDLVNDFVGLTGLVTRESLEALEGTFGEPSNEESISKSSSPSNVQAAASRFLGRFWTGPSSSAKATTSTSSLAVAEPSQPSSFLRRTPSKQSMASTLNSIESTESHLSAASTEATAMSRNPSADCTPVKAGNTFANSASSVGITSQDRDLHTQIEDLLTALSDMQREQTQLANEVQKEREEREEDRAAVQRFLERAKKSAALDVIPEGQPHSSLSLVDAPAVALDGDEALMDLELHFNTSSNKRSSLMQQTKHQMREDLKLWKDQYEVEATRSADLTRQLAAEKIENARLLEQFREARTRMQDAHQDKQRLEKTLSEMRSRRFSTDSEYESTPATPVDVAPTPGGLRELKLGRSGSLRSNTAPTQPFAKRSSSLGISAVLATDDHKPATEDALLLELVNAKTAEAVARQELEEVKAKLDSLRKMIGGGLAPKASSGHRPSASEACIAKVPSVATAMRPAVETLKPAAAPAGGFFSGWGKRTASNPSVPES
ncbi:MAG: ecotropic viral integration site [Alectoria sarmentosa]|nr:MAG: ecotropic viral integration site [Alectoria sarmentosa]